MSRITVNDLGHVNKKIRKRKGYFRFLQRTIEFYLSDANLRRDPFLRKALDDKLEIDLSTFIKFNSVQNVGADVEDLKTALKPSESLELADNNKVRKKFPITEKSKEDVDECSLYVERLPPDTTHESLAKIFSPFGNVVMVTIPKYKTNKKVKGYGFIEFEHESSCSLALETFSSYGGILGNQPEFSGCKTCKYHMVDDDTGTENKRAKLNSDVFKDGNNKPGEKKTEMEPNPDPKEVKTDETAADPSLPKVVVLDTEKRKRNRKKKKSQRTVNYTYMGLKIMAKSVWNQMRFRYLSMQAANRRSMKTQLAKLKRPSTRPPKIDKLVPGSVATLTAVKPVTENEAKALKAHLRQMEAVQYVDIESGQVTGYVRFSNSESASSFVYHAPDTLKAYKLGILPSSAEDLYWAKMKQDRNKMLKSETKKKNIGGGKKILMRAEKELGVKIRLSPSDTI